MIEAQVFNFLDFSVIIPWVFYLFIMSCPMRYQTPSFCLLEKKSFFCLYFVCQFCIHSHSSTMVDQASAYRTIVYFVSFLMPSHRLLQKADACCYRHAFYISSHLPELFP